MVEVLVLLDTSFGSIGMWAESERAVAHTLRSLKRVGARLHVQLPSMARTSKPHKRRGRAETSLIIEKLMESAIPRGFLKKSRTTRDVLKELRSKFDMPFTSRKVSQALGVLRKRGVLDRVGMKGHFMYIKKS